MLILAFESSCDETAAAVVRAEGERLTVLSNIVATQIETHRLYGGVVPEIASRAHIEQISPITYEALAVAGVTLAEMMSVKYIVGYLVGSIVFAVVLLAFQLWQDKKKK